MEPSVLSIYNLVVRSGLLSETDAQAMFQRWRGEAKDANNVGHFSKWMVAQGIVTDYQASLLAKGHAEGFFLNQYRILDRLGKGRMAGVYKALHPLGQVVAIKVLPPSKAKDPQMFGRFQREARLSVGLAQRNIVRTFQVGEANGVHYLVMEYLEGETLDEVFKRRGKLTPAEAVPIVYQALLGLQHLYEKSMVHRDLKPANLMLIPSASGNDPKDLAHATVKILDIGLARVLADEGAPDKPGQPHLTTEGLLLGTPDYMAPEQAREARTADIRADIYSLGCVLYHSLAGQPPFPDMNIISQMIRHASEPARPLTGFNSAVPDGLQQIVNWMMAKDPAQRYATPERAAKALEVFLAARDDLNTVQKPDAKMESYLSWLEMQIEHVEKPAPKTEEPIAALSRPEPARPGAAAPSASASAKQQRMRPETQTVKAVVKERFQEAVERKTANLPETPAPPSSAEPGPAFDVELIPVSPRSKPVVGPWKDLRLSRRDFLMFGIGAGTVLFAMAIGKILAWIVPLKKASLQPVESSESATEK